MATGAEIAFPTDRERRLTALLDTSYGILWDMLALGCPCAAGCDCLLHDLEAELGLDPTNG